MDMPDILDISHLRGAGKQPDEEELADAAPVSAAPGAVLVLDFLCYAMLFCKGSFYVVVMCRGHYHNNNSCSNSRVVL